MGGFAVLVGVCVMWGDRVVAVDTVKLGGEVQYAKAKLLRELTPGERLTKRTSGSGPPFTFEDAAAFIAGDMFDIRQYAVQRAYYEYQSKINAFWGYVYEDGIVDNILHSWLKTSWGRRCSKGISYDDLKAEASLAVRRAISHWKPNGKSTFEYYAKIGVRQALADYSARSNSPVEIPEKVRRKDGPKNRRISLGIFDFLTHKLRKKGRDSLEEEQ